MPNYGKKYEHIDDAAAAALMALARQPRVEAQEYMGLLTQDPETGLFQRTDFQTQGSRLRSEWKGYPEGKIAGIVHTHPSPRNGDKYPHTLFSEQDVETANSIGGQAYMAAMPARYPARSAGLPKDLKLQRNGPRHRESSREGEPFLAQFPIEEFQEYLMRKLLERSANDPRGLLR